MADSFALPAPLSTYGLDPAQNAELLTPATYAPLIDPAEAAAAAAKAQQGSLIDSQLSRLPTQQGIGHQNILDAYNSAFQTLTNQKATGERDYNTARNQTQNDNLQARENIGTGVRNTLGGVQRLLGMRGAGNSSASSILAPYAAGREGGIQNNQVGQQFGRNMGALDTGWSDALTSFTNAFGQLLGDRTNKDRSLDSNIDSTKASLLARKQALTGDPSLTNEINALGGQIDQLGAQQTFTPAAVNAKPADTGAYDYTKFNAPTLGSNVDPALASNLGAFWTLLQGKDKQKANPVGV